MKKYILSLTGFLIITFSFSSSYSQWVMRSPYPTVNDVYDFHAFNAINIIAVSYGISIGESMLSFDGGITWSVQSASPERPYRRVVFVNAQTGYAIGGGPTDKPVKSTNGGLNWTALSGSIDTTKYGVKFIDAMTGWMMGFNGFIQKTTDGGATWISQSNPGVTTKTIWCTDATDANTVWGSASDNTIIKSTNGGAAFTLLPTIFRPSTDDFRYIKFLTTGTGQTGFVFGERQRIARTTNGGANWDSVYANNTGSVVLYSADFNSVFTAGLAVGSSGTILRTTNLGTTWDVITTSFTDDFFSVKFADNNTVYIGGKNGRILKSTDAGLTWGDMSRRIYSGTLNGVSFGNNNVGFVSGTTGFIGKTTNQGLTYATLNSGVTVELDNIKAVDANTAYVVGDGGTILKTSNGGTNWAALTSGTTQDLLGIDFLDAQTGFVGGAASTVLKTTNGGANWTAMSAPEADFLTWNMDFLNLNTGYICGSLNGKVYKTTNSGQTWTQQLNDGTMIGMYAISFVNDQTGYCAGGSGKTYKTTNGGTNWVAGPTLGASIWGMDFANALNGIAVGGSGYTYMTTDGGATWNAPPRLTFNQLNAVHFNDDGNFAWTVGNLGLLLQYDNPLVNVTQTGTTAPEKFLLEQNYPNPFNPNTVISYQLPADGFVTLKVYDMMGREAASLVNANQTAGSYSVSFNASNLSSGVYYYKIETGDFSETKKMLLVK
ncbi:MAG: T9SS type A sorting domain-containing protein [Ignavibacteria bacterium]|nr:T9SS type A sorting domain-containing protein [Ignavibacteria bacterium]